MATSYKIYRILRGFSLNEFAIVLISLQYVELALGGLSDVPE